MFLNVVGIAGEAWYFGDPFATELGYALISPQSLIPSGIRGGIYSRRHADFKPRD
jgi:hypothetical protein